MKEILINKNQLEMARVDDPSNIPFKNKKFDEFIEEGIDFNKKSMTVWFTPTEERYVDTSLENNPIMDKERGGMFSRHFVKDREMRNVLTDTFKVSALRCARKSKYITDKDILIIDDTIGNGQTIKSACQVMMESYAPKSITVLTLLSKLH